MFEEAQLYSPVSHHDDGTVEVHLGANHPGFNDPDYRARRNAIAARAVAWQPGEPLPRIDYTEGETAIWRQVSHELADKHRRRAHPEYLAAKERLGLPTEQIPQLDEVSAALTGLTGFSYVAAPGLVELREFYSSLGDRVFHSTQYVRHPSEPLYTPEPDVIHELVGHAPTLAHPALAALNQKFGHAARIADRPGLARIERVYWFTLEFGVCLENGAIKAIGAGLLSSFGELERCPSAPTRLAWDLDRMAQTDYDTSRYQDRLFVAPSFARMVADVDAWLDAQIRGR